MKIQFAQALLPQAQQKTLSEGFAAHSSKTAAPQYDKKHIHWSIMDDNEQLIGALTADILWNWIYIDELWISDNYQGKGMGKQLMEKMEEYAIANKLTGIWLWTQSWQAPQFYQSLGFVEFTRFDDFPAGHCRIGLRKYLS